MDKLQEGIDNFAGGWAGTAGDPAATCPAAPAALPRSRQLRVRATGVLRAAGLMRALIVLGCVSPRSGAIPPASTAPFRPRTLTAALSLPPPPTRPAADQRKLEDMIGAAMEKGEVKH